MHSSIKCIECNSNDIVSVGRQESSRAKRYKCKSCGRYFTLTERSKIYTLRKTNPDRNGEHFCVKCNTYKPFSEFIFVKKTNKYFSYCRSCGSLKQRLGAYGISESNYYGILELQDNKCAICHDVLTHIDHNHETGKVRGILCLKCNSILGFSRDSIDILYNSINYLKKFQE